MHFFGGLHPFDRSDIEEIKSYLAHFYLGGSRKTIDETAEAVKLMDQAKNLGSIMKFDLSEQTRAALQIRMDEWRAEEHVPDAIKKFYKYADIILALTDKYHALVMNPPYMGATNMNSSLSKYLKDNYEEGKADLCTAFTIVQKERSVSNGYYANIIPPSWMFLTTFERLRQSILNNQEISSLVQLSNGVFGGDFGSVTTTFRNATPSKVSRGTYFRLVKKSLQFIEQSHLHKMFKTALSQPGFRIDLSQYDHTTDSIKHNEKGNLVVYKNINQLTFLEVPGSPIGYWKNTEFIDSFRKTLLGSISESSPGIRTGKDSLFIRNWHEVSFKDTSTTSSDANDLYLNKWFPITRGGEYRRWYGNLQTIILGENKFADVLAICDDYRLREESFYFKQGITWTMMTASSPTFRVCPRGVLFGNGGPTLYAEIQYEEILGFLNSKVANDYLSFINPTINYTKSDMESLPILFSRNDSIKAISKECVSISKQDWDAHETSWDFEENELIELGKDTLSEAFEEYRQKWADMFYQLHSNEEELNRQFIEIYGLQDELTPDVPLDEITILQQGEIKIENGEVVFQRDEVMRQFVSYLVGLIMGRYRLDKKGLNIAHPEATDEELASYTYRNGIVEIDGDGILPLMGGDCSFVDNALKRLSELVRVIFGDESHARNMAFINDCLGKSLEDYLTKDFYGDHLKRYQKRPIYWLFSSKKGAFKVLAYMHRMDRYTAEMIRNKYLLPHIESQRVAIADLEQRMAVLTTAERKKLERLRKEHEECIEYHERLHAKADEQIGFDLDDGVVVNYAKFGDVLAKLK